MWCDFVFVQTQAKTKTLYFKHIYKMMLWLWFKVNLTLWTTLLCISIFSCHTLANLVSNYFKLPLNTIQIWGIVTTIYRDLPESQNFDQIVNANGNTQT